MKRLFGYCRDGLAQLQELFSDKYALILTGPSSSGKSFVANHLCSGVSPILKVRMCSTKQPIPGILDGEYAYISFEQFELMRQNDEFLQWQKFPDRCYGISMCAVRESLQRSSVGVLIDIGIGAALGLNAFFNRNGIFSIPIFLSPVPKEILLDGSGIEYAVSLLRDRLLKRGRGESHTDIEGRLETARWWFRKASQLPFHFVANKENMGLRACEQIAEIVRQSSLLKNTVSA